MKGFSKEHEIGREGPSSRFFSSVEPEIGFKSTSGVRLVVDRQWV